MFVTNCVTVIIKKLYVSVRGKNNYFLGLARFLVNSKTIFGVTSR